MIKQLVNHNGFIQFKYIIKTYDDIHEYVKINAEMHVQYFQEMLNDHCMSKDVSEINNTIQQLITMHAQNTKQSIICSTLDIAEKKIQNLEKAINKGFMVVINGVGGWCYWNDNEMQILDQTAENLAKLSNKGIMSTEPNITINESNVLVLENQSILSKGVLKHVNELLQVSVFSSLIRMKNADDSIIIDAISRAMKNGCKVIVAESTLIDKEQIKKIAKLFKYLPSIEFHLITSENLHEELINAIGEIETNLLYQKHKILTFQY